MSLLREDPVFEDVISIKYNVGNDEMDKFVAYHEKIDAFYHRLMEENA